MSEQHVCPYGGIWKSRHFINPGSSVDTACGKQGGLCDMCKRDASRENTNRLVEGLALAGLLANPEAQHATGTKRELCEHASLYAAALREREGGEGS